MALILMLEDSCVDLYIKNGKDGISVTILEMIKMRIASPKKMGSFKLEITQLMSILS